MSKSLRRSFSFGRNEQKSHQVATAPWHEEPLDKKAGGGGTNDK
jgi:hypothetical protein